MRFADSALFMAAHEKCSALCFGACPGAGLQTQSSNFGAGTETNGSPATHQHHLQHLMTDAVRTVMLLQNRHRAACLENTLG